MKRFIAIFLILSCLLPVISLHAEEPTGGEDIVEPVEPTYDSVIEISKNKDSINLSYELFHSTPLSKEAFLLHLLELLQSFSKHQDIHQSLLERLSKRLILDKRHILNKSRLKIIFKPYICSIVNSAI